MLKLLPVNLICIDYILHIYDLYIKFSNVLLYTCIIWHTYLHVQINLFTVI